MENKIKFINATFNDISRHYPNMKVGGSIFHCAMAGISKKILRSNILNPENSEELLQRARAHDLLLVGGWNYRDSHLTKKWRHLISRNYMPMNMDAINPDIHSKILQWKSTNKKTFGIHVRRGDYKEWKNGKYYFDDQFY